MRRLFCVLVLLGCLLGTARADAAEQETSKPKHIKVPVKRKPTDENWTLRETRTVELLDGFQPGAKKIQHSKYGGRGDKKAPATG